MTNDNPFIMRRLLLLFAVGLGAVACDGRLAQDPEGDPFSIEQPAPEGVVTRVGLDEAQRGYVRQGNKLSFSIFQKLYQQAGGSFIYSPLSLELALAMTANGAEGETLKEILAALGYDREGLDALNAYAHLILDQLPALDPDVTVKLADAVLVTDRYKLQSGFIKTLKDCYYAPAASMSFSNPSAVLAKLNDWVKRNTNGLIYPMLEDMDPNAVAYLMNALYFKAPWQGNKMNAMFDSRATFEDKFFRLNGTSTEVSYMPSTRTFPYADMGDYQTVAIPYASGKFNMYILLPKKNDGIGALVASLGGLDWSGLTAKLKTESQVALRLPKFDVAVDFLLNEALKGVGVRRAFDDSYAEFGAMFDDRASGFYISRVLQKARMTVAEWGTEAAATTVVEVSEKSAWFPKVIEFYADHPFVFVIADHDSGIILFEGVYAGN